MHKQKGYSPHRFGDATTADVILRLQWLPLSSASSSSSRIATSPETSCSPSPRSSSSSASADLNPEDHVVLHVHSVALRRSEYFAVRLSERWAPDLASPLVLTLPPCKNVDVYMRCIKLMYLPDKTLKGATFHSVQDALDVLEVSAELLFHDCVNACLCFLEAVPWSHEEEIAVRSCISAWHLQVTSDLGARLCTPEHAPDCRPLDIMKDVLGELLSLVSNGAPTKAREITERVLRANAEPNASPAFAAVNEAALSAELLNNLELLKSQLRKFANFFSWNSHQLHVASSALRWLLEELFVLEMADIAIKVFAEEQDLAQLMVSRIYQNPFTETLFAVLVRILRALKTGQVVIPRKIRFALVTTWLPVIAKLASDSDEPKDSDVQQDLEKGLCAVVGTLTVTDQQEIFKIWIGACLKTRKAWPDLSPAFDSWCNNLRHAVQDQDSGQDCSLSNTVSDAKGISST